MTSYRLRVFGSNGTILITYRNELATLSCAKRWSRSKSREYGNVAVALYDMTCGAAACDKPVFELRATLATFTGEP